MTPAATGGRPPLLAALADAKKTGTLAALTPSVVSEKSSLSTPVTGSLNVTPFRGLGIFGNG